MVILKRDHWKINLVGIAVGLGFLSLPLSLLADEVSNRQNYRAGVLHFKESAFMLARQKFEPLALGESSSFLMRVASQNMLAQSFRFEGKDRLALAAFARLIDLFEKESTSSVALTQLWGSAILARGEIYQVQQNFEKSEGEYQKLIVLLSQPLGQSFCVLSLAEVMERCLGINFQLGRMDRTFELTDRLVQRFPEYERVGLLLFQAECIRFCQANGLEMGFEDGVSALAAGVILDIKRERGKFDLTILLNALEGLEKEYGESSCLAVLLYHHGWLLDAMGRGCDAAEVFARLGAVEKKGLAWLGGYGAVQQAIIFSEQEKYAQAIDLLNSLPRFGKRPHLDRLIVDVKESIYTLMRGNSK